MKPIPSSTLRSRLAQGQPAEPHPDADLLTAFAEDTLLDRERTEILSHLAGCNACRAVVQTAVSAVPVLAPLAEERPIRPPLRAWLPGVALAAALFVMGASTVLFYRAIHVNAPGTQSAANAPAAQIPPAREAGPPPAAASPATPEPHVAAARTAPPAPARKHPANAAHVTPAATVPAPQTGEDENLTLGAAAPPPAAAVGASSHGSFGDVSARSSAAAPPPPDQAQMQSELRARNMSAYHGAVAASKAAPRSSVPASVGGSVRVQPGNALATAPRPLGAMGALTIPTSAHPGFRINDAGQIERSVETGIWTPAAIAAEVRFRVLSILGADVWAGGDRLRLFHSADNGLTWAEVQLPANGDRTHAIAHIRLDSAQALHVESDDGTVWTTADGGATWK